MGSAKDVAVGTVEKGTLGRPMLKHRVARAGCGDSGASWTSSRGDEA